MAKSNIYTTERVMFSLFIITILLKNNFSRFFKFQFFRVIIIFFISVALALVLLPDIFNYSCFT